MKRKNFPGRKKERKIEAEQRQVEYDKLTTLQKLARLPDEGATKQRLRLALLRDEEMKL